MVSVLPASGASHCAALRETARYLQCFHWCVIIAREGGVHADMSTCTEHVWLVSSPLPCLPSPPPFLFSTALPLVLTAR